MTRRNWFVWETEYPDDGTQLVTAPTAWAAKAKVRRSWNAKRSEPLDMSVELTARLADETEARRWWEAGQ